MKRKWVDWQVRGGTLAAVVLAFSAGSSMALSGQPRPAASMSVPSRVSAGATHETDTPSIALIRGRSILQVAVSPDGKRLAWMDSVCGGTEIRVAPFSDLSKSERVTAATGRHRACEEYGLAWAPNGDELAFFSDCAQPEKQADLYLSHLDAKPAQRLTKLRGRAGDPAFSPDGSQIAFLLVGTAEGGKPEPGELGVANGAVQRIAVVRANQTGGHALAPVTVVSPANLLVYEFDWSPDGKSIAYVASEGVNPARACGNRLFVQSLAETGPASSSMATPDRAPRIVLNPEAAAHPVGLCRIAGPRWSPDGQQIAFIGAGGDDSPEASVWMVDAEGGTPRNLSQGRPTSAGWIEWESGEHLFVSEVAGGNTQLLRYRLPEKGQSSNSAVSFGAPILSVTGSVDDGRMCFSLSATEDHALFVFRARSKEGPLEIYSAKPGVVMSAGLEGVLQLSHSGEGPSLARDGPTLTLWNSEKYRVEEWRCRPRVPARRRIVR